MSDSSSSTSTSVGGARGNRAGASAEMEEGPTARVRQDESMRTADRQQIGLRVVQEMANELRNLLTIADERRQVRGELAG